MNGATALDCEKTISSPNSTKTTTIGMSQYFFSWRRNCQNSDRTRPLLMMILSLRHETTGGHDQCSRRHRQRHGDRNQMDRKAAGVGGASGDEPAQQRAGAENDGCERETADHRDPQQREKRTADTAEDGDGAYVEARRVLDGGD